MKYTLTILSACVLCAFCTKAVTYSDTWDGNAANQYFTYKALNNGEANGFIISDGNPPDTREIYTKNDVTTYPIFVIGGVGGSRDISGTFGSFTTGQALTRADVEGTLGMLQTNSSWVTIIPFELYTLYAPKNRILSTLAVNDQLYTNRERTTTFAPSGTIYMRGAFKYTINSSGVITGLDPL